MHTATELAGACTLRAEVRSVWLAKVGPGGHLHQVYRNSIVQGPGLFTKQQWAMCNTLTALEACKLDSVQSAGCQPPQQASVIHCCTSSLE